jgi:glyoxylase I family protein
LGERSESKRGSVTISTAGSARFPPVAIQSFSHVGICVSDLAASRRFYENVLGFKHLFDADLGPEIERTMEVPGCQFTSCLLGREDLNIELIGYREPAVQGDGTRRPMNLLGLTHLCFRVEKADELAELAEQNGGTFHRQTETELPGFGVDGGSIISVHLTDPDGTRIECIVNQPALSEAARALFA